jgi:uncharacterized repeat protein (TIGR01451 family)
MGNHRWYRYAALWAALCCGTPALAQSAPQGARGSVELATVVEKLVTTVGPDGETKTDLAPVEMAVPGDEVVYTVTFTNVSGGVAENIRITNPIPPQVRYVPDTAFGPGSAVLYSADGGRSYGAPAELFVVAPDGTRRAATADDYTHIRWVLGAPLDVGAKGFARFRAVVR